MLRLRQASMMLNLCQVETRLPGAGKERRA